MSDSDAAAQHSIVRHRPVLTLALSNKKGQVRDFVAVLDEGCGTVDGVGRSSKVTAA